MTKQISRRGILAAGVATTLASASSAGAQTQNADRAGVDQEWPEFRQWYALTMEEEQLYNADISSKEREAGLDAVDAQSGPLEAAMIARQPRSLTHLAIVAVLRLRCLDSMRSPEPGCRLLEVGLDPELTAENPVARLGVLENEAILRLALDQGLLPGIEIHGLSAGYGAFRSDRSHLV